MKKNKFAIIWIAIILLMLIIDSKACGQRSTILPSVLTWDSISNITDTTTGEILFCSDCGDNGTLVVFNKGNWEMVIGTSFDIPATPVFDSAYVVQNQITWDWDTSATATGYKFNTTNSYATATDLTNVSSKVETSLTCNYAYTRYVWAYNIYGHSNVLTMTATTGDCFNCDSLTITHNAGIISPITATIKYYLIDSIPGDLTKCWLKQNLGSSAVPTSKSDTTNTGWYWKFNNIQGYQYEDSTRTPSSTWISTNTSANWSSINDPCLSQLGTGWRIPTATEWFNALTEGEWKNYDSTYDSRLKLSAAGRLTYTTGNGLYQGLLGYYWSSNQYNTAYGKLLYITSTSVAITNYYKNAGCSIRCIH